MLYFLLKGKQIAELNVNEEIRSKKLLVIAPDGVQVGELELKKALILAEELDLDLVEVSPESKPPVARLMDYGKYKFELKQKARESKKKQVKINVKEIQLKPKIDTNDYRIKLNQSKKFLEGKSPPDFAPEDYEINYKGRVTVNDLSELAKKQLGLVNWN